MHSAAAAAAAPRRAYPVAVPIRDELAPHCPPRAPSSPASIPTLLIVWLVCRIRGAAFVIDWHNFGYTVLGMSLGAAHPLVRIATVYERALASTADYHICVTDAMRRWLLEHWGVT